MPSQLDEIIEKVREKVKLYPNNVYRRPEGEGYCSYFRGNNTQCPDSGCIFGIVLKELGYDFPDVGNIETLLDMLRISHDEGDKLNWCMTVQNLQDEGKTWQEAITYADENFGGQC